MRDTRALCADIADTGVVTCLQDWAAMTDNERHFISRVLAFFAASDGIVNENLATNFSSEVRTGEFALEYLTRPLTSMLSACLSVPRAGPDPGGPLLLRLSDCHGERAQRGVQLAD